MSTTEMTVRKSVERAAAWLDVRVPGWHDRINVETLEIEDACRCVGGQLGGYTETVIDYGDDHGIDPWADDTEAETAAFWSAEATDLWRAEIAKRVAVPVSA